MEGVTPANCIGRRRALVSRVGPFGMRDETVHLLLVAAVLVFVLQVGASPCPQHCFCYTWNGLLRTDCIGKNLFNTFVGFSHLTQVLDLSYNVISILHGNEFLDANLKNLQDLRLSNNRLYKIDKLTFNGLILLESLDLSSNSIEHLHPSIFEQNPNLKILNMSFNPLSLKKGESFLSRAPSLQILDVADCRLEFLGYRSFLNLDRLALLNITRNNIRKIEEDFLNGIKNLKYLDMTSNDLPCNDQTQALLQLLKNRNIQFRTFCQDQNQKMVMIPMMHSKGTESLQVELLQNVDYNDSSKQNVLQEDDGIFEQFAQFFRSIPSFYAIICGVHVGILIGSFLTYLCMKRAIKNQKINARERIMEETTTSFGLISLRTPPGTPPSPYRSRLFLSNFSLPGT